MLKEFLLERIDRFVILPVVHHSYEFTLVAREAFREIKPAAVAVEYPFSCRLLVEKAIERLPRISVLVIGEKQRRYIRFEPVDPFVEGFRLAKENHIPAECIDANLPDYPEILEPMPDTYALQFLGHRKFCEKILEHGFPQTSEDLLRERAMAFRLQQMKGNGTVLVLCGLAHLHGLKEQLQQAQAQPFEKQIPAKLFHLSSNSLGEIMGHFPFFTSVFELQRALPPSGAVVPVGHQSRADTSAPRMLEKEGLQIVEGKRERDLTQFVEGAQYDVASGTADRREILTRYLFWCRTYYEQEIDDRISPQQMMLLDNFARKYASVKMTLLPGFYELLIAGRSCISSHFCYRMWEIAINYPAQHGASELEILELRADDIFPLVSKVRMNPNPPLRPRIPRFLRKYEKQRKPKKEDWRFSPYSICSYQPEDIAVEGYGTYLRSKGKSILSEEKKRVRPFETSLLDGIDLRETIRNWHTGQIFVQECTTVKGAADSIVVIFDEEYEKYSHTMTWLGEHHQESDMAFYATDPEERMIGPGIRKALYGGFLMTMPPGRLFDVFHDPAYGWTLNYAEKLLMAGIDYGLQKYVVYAGPKPPRPFFQVIAGRYGKRILYIPLAQLSPVMLQKIRTFHILSDKSVRDYAKDYIW